MPVRPVAGAGTEVLALIGGNADGGDTGGPSDDTEPDQNDGETIAVTWNWGAEEVIADFDPASDTLDFDHVPSHLIDFWEVGDDLVFEILNNGGHRYVQQNVKAEDLEADNLSQAPHATALDGEVIDQLVALGADDWMPMTG